MFVMGQKMRAGSGLIDVRDVGIAGFIWKHLRILSWTLIMGITG